jgi:hypothetical protein
MKKLLSEALFSVIFVLLLSFLIFIGCTAAEPKNAEGIEKETLFRHHTEDIVHSNNEKVNVELLHKTIGFNIYKITINDTIVSYVAYDYHTGLIKLN